MPRSAHAKLATYRKKRDFGVTSEPSGARAPSTAHDSFVIQKHAARRLHYDFRLELDGVLLSWSVPKGPSLKVGEKRLAVRTEDHPLDYAGFEGIIPEGQYGGGTVVVWDRGTWAPEGDPREGMKKGRLTFELAGEKLHGRWHLVRTRGGDRTENWLLMKSEDDAASDKIDIVEAQPKSVISGRTVDEVAADADKVWHSNRAGGGEGGAAPAAAKPKARAARTATSKAAAAPTGDLNTLLSKLPLGFKLTSLDKILYPGQGLTKGQLIAYLAVVAERMLPHVAHRPLTLVRCPSGAKKPCFFQKHIAAGTPPPVEKVPIDDELYMEVHDMPGVVALAQMGTLEIHTWGCHDDAVEKPDILVFDLDPDPTVEWDAVALAALELRKRLRDMKLESFVKTTGGKGLHVCVPIERRTSWDDAKAFTKSVAEAMEADDPSRFTTNMAKAKRAHKIFLDYLRNGRGATFVAPYSPRAREGAPVAVPITWEHLATGVDPTAFTVETLPKLLGSMGDDPWAEFFTTKQAIRKAARR